MDEIFRYQGPNDDYLILCVIDDDEYYVYQGGAYLPKADGLKLADAIYKEQGNSWAKCVDESLSNLRYENKEMQALIYGLFKYIHSVTENYGDDYNVLERKAVEIGLTLPDELRIGED